MKKENVEMLRMNELAERGIDNLTKEEQNEFIDKLYVNVGRYTYTVFNKIGRRMSNTLDKDVYDGIVQDVVLSLFNILKNNKFESDKAKFSTLLGTYVKNKVYKEGYLEKMAKRNGITVPMIFENEDGTTHEWLSSEDDVEEEVVDKITSEEKIKIVRTAISKLTEREQKIINMRMEEKSLAEIGKSIGLTRERVRQILLSISRKLRVNIDLKAG